MFTIEEYGKVLTQLKQAPGNTVRSFGSELYKYTERTLAYTHGGTTEIAVGNWIVGATGGAIAHVKSITLASGTWAGGNATGVITLCSQLGTFQSENIKVAAGTDDATIVADSVVRQDQYDNKGAEARAAQIQACDQTVLACWDGSTPDQTLLYGMKLAANTVVVLTNYDSIRNFKFVDYTAASVSTVRAIFYF